MARSLLKHPKNWTVVTLEANREKGFIVQVDSGGTPSTARDEYWDGDVPWLTPKEITDYKGQIYVSRTERCITQEGLGNSGAKLFPPNTVMLTKRAPVGAVAINVVPMATNQGFLNFQCGDNLRPLFLAHWMKINTRYLQQIANGSTYRELYKSDLFELEIAIPSIKEQDAIISTINALQLVTLLGSALEHSVERPELVINLQQQDQRLSSLRDSLTVELLSGKMNPVLFTGQPSI